jgi:hypothetical protein
MYGIYNSKIINTPPPSHLPLEAVLNKVGGEERGFKDIDRKI